jgi:arsenite methyltransferase
MAELTDPTQIRDAVRERYAAAARAAAAGGSGCGCGASGDEASCLGGGLYAGADADGAPDEALAASLGLRRAHGGRRPA